MVRKKSDKDYNPAAPPSLREFGRAVAAGLLEPAVGAAAIKRRWCGTGRRRRGIYCLGCGDRVACVGILDETTGQLRLRSLVDATECLHLAGAITDDKAGMIHQAGNLGGALA